MSLLIKDKNTDYLTHIIYKDDPNVIKFMKITSNLTLNAEQAENSKSAGR